MKIVITSITDSGILRVRSELIQELFQKKYKVYVVTPQVNDYKALIEMGCEFVPINIQAHGTNPANDFKVYKDYLNIYRRIRPDVVVSYTIKPNVYSGLACQRLKIPYIATINGIGDAIFNRGVLAFITLNLLKIGLRKAEVVFFQNKKNQQLFNDKKVVSEIKSVLIPGSGINLDIHPFEEFPKIENPITLTFIGRISRDKGIYELIEAGLILKKKGYQFLINIVGNCPDTFRKLIDDAEKNGFVHYIGKVHFSEIHKILAKSSAVILPSYHEGIANVLLEGGAAGRPIIASFAEGCEDTFDDGISGIGFEPKNVDSLVTALERFFKMTNEERRIMGMAARNKIAIEFDRKIVTAAYVDKISLIERSFLYNSSKGTSQKVGAKKDTSM